MVTTVSKVVPLPYRDIAPEPFVARWVFLGLSIQPEGIVTRPLPAFRTPSYRDYERWCEPLGLASDDPQCRLKAWLAVSHRLVDWLFAHSLIDYSSLPIYKDQNGVWSMRSNYHLEYCWLSWDELWCVVVSILEIPPSWWVIVAPGHDYIAKLERRVRSYCRKHRLSPHDIPEVYPEWVDADSSVFRRHGGMEKEWLWELKERFEELFQWLHEWVYAPYDVQVLLRHMEVLSYRLFTIYRIILHGRNEW